MIALTRIKTLKLSASNPMPSSPIISCGPLTHRDLESRSNAFNMVNKLLSTMAKKLLLTMTKRLLLTMTKRLRSTMVKKPEKKMKKRVT